MSKFMQIKSKLKASFPPPGGGGRSTFFFFGGCVPRGFQNVGYRERFFLEKLGSWERKFRKIWVSRAKILAKTWLKMQKFSKNWKQGAQERRIDGKLVG